MFFWYLIKKIIAKTNVNECFPVFVCYCYYFYPSSFIVPSLTFKFWSILTFVSGVRYGFSFIILHVNIQFAQHHLVNKLSFHQCVFFPLLSKINCVYGIISWISYVLLMYVPVCIPVFLFIFEVSLLTHSSHIRISMYQPLDCSTSSEYHLSLICTRLQQGFLWSLFSGFVYWGVQSFLVCMIWYFSIFVCEKYYGSLNLFIFNFMYKINYCFLHYL